jgi:HK97 gp10 family phage protein
MATAGIRLELDTTNLEELIKRIGNIFEKPERAAILESALKKAMEPALARLKALTPIGPTGNLRSAAMVETKAYDRSGNAVALLGYQRSAKSKSRKAAGGKVRIGPDRAFHQYWLEDGTSERNITTIANKPYGRKSHRRVTKSGTVTTVKSHMVKRGQGSVIASSYSTLGPFKLAPTPRQDEGQRVDTQPGYPAAFFRKAKRGESITIAPMPAGGRSGQPPLKTAWEETRTTVAEILQRELRISLEAAVQSLVFSGTGNL